MRAGSSCSSRCSLKPSLRDAAAGVGLGAGLGAGAAAAARGGSAAAGTAAEIVRGASDESEMGVFHDLFEPQRAANLRARLEEYTVAGFSTGIIFTS